MRHFLRGPLAAALLLIPLASAYAETPRLMVVTSDPQYPWTDRIDEGGSLSDVDWDEAERLVREQYESIAGYRRAHPLDTIPVIVNGDLTARGHNTERQTMDELLRILGDNVFLGLGNHDYQNNLKNDGWCAATFCAMETLDFLTAHVQSHRRKNHQVLDFDLASEPGGRGIAKRGSWSYGFIAPGWPRVVNVQLNNSPTYQADIFSPRYEYHVTPSVPWLAQRLPEWDQPAMSDFVLLHTHKPYDWTFGASPELASLVEAHRVKAVFAGHFHKDMGEEHDFRYWGSVPVFLSGSASQRTYLIVEHWPESRLLKVFGVRHNDWEKKELLSEIPL